jgi:hypothetical protein
VLGPNDLGDVGSALALRGDGDQVGGKAALEFLAEQVLAAMPSCCREPVALLRCASSSWTLTRLS